uniref:Pinin/SDK/MemA protein domain-containing protein n=1 Tax=Brassica campestris TaxID=3711 RepID=M4EDB7_BRACM
MGDTVEEKTAGYEAIALPEPAPRQLPKNEDPSLVKRNRRMLGNLLGTLERFRKEDKQLSGTDAYARRSAVLQKTLRARVAAKAEQKELELLFLRWCEEKKKRSNFIRATDADQRKEQTFLEWKAAKRQEVSEYQKEVEERYLSNVEKELERWQNARKARKANNEAMNLQETMDKELETHRMEHGLKKRKIPGAGGEDEEDEVEDISGGEDDITIDDLLQEGGDGNVKEVATDTAEAVEGDITL